MDVLDCSSHKCIFVLVIDNYELGRTLPIPTWIKSTPSLIGESSFPCRADVSNFAASRVKDRLLIEKNGVETLLEILKHQTDVTANDIIANTVICILYTQTLTQ